MLYKNRLTATAGLVILFCASFLIFFGLFMGQAKEQPKQPSLPDEVLNQRLPESHLIDVSGAELKSDELQHGKVVLVLATPECPLCLEESKFLGGLVGKRPDVRFYGVVPYGADKEVLREAAGKFPFKMFFDEGYRLRRGLKINRVPVKLYLEDGVVKKSWVGATSFFHGEKEFGDWLESLR